MTGGRFALAVLGGLLLGTPGAALAAGPLDCMAQTYDAGELAEIGGFSEGFSLDTDAEGSNSADIADFALVAADECAGQYDWSDDQVYFAMIYEVSRLSETAYRESGSMPTDQLQLLDSALAKRERTELWALLERAAVAGLNGEQADFNRQEEFMMGAFVLSAKIDDALAEKVGELMGIMALKRYAQREFEKAGLQ